MYSENDTKNTIINFQQYLSTDRAVGNEEISSTLQPDDEYTDTKSTSPRFKRFQKLTNSQIFEPEVNIAMDDNKLLEKYMDKVDQDQRDLRNELEEREARIENRIAEAENREKERMDRIEKLFLQQSEKIDMLKDEVSKQLEDEKKYRHTNNIAIILGVIATIVALAGIYFATISTITDIINLAVPNM